MFIDVKHSSDNKYFFNVISTHFTLELNDFAVLSSILGFISVGRKINTSCDVDIVMSTN